jgi:hypothetical protein
MASYEKSEAALTLMKLRKAKEEVQKLEAEYRKVCECNALISGAKLPKSEPKTWVYEKIYKTCKYHEVKYYYNG